jgi:urea transporter
VESVLREWLKADKAALMVGLYDYNGVLAGLALATFLA